MKMEIISIKPKRYRIHKRLDGSFVAIPLKPKRTHIPVTKIYWSEQYQDYFFIYWFDYQNYYRASVNEASCLLTSDPMVVWQHYPRECYDLLQVAEF